MMGERFRKTDSCGTAYTRIYELIEHPILESVERVEDLYCFHALHYEVLVGDKKGIESVRVGQKYRIEFRSERVENEKVVTICNIIELSNHYH